MPIADKDLPWKTPDFKISLTLQKEDLPTADTLWKKGSKICFFLSDD